MPAQPADPDSHGCGTRTRAPVGAAQLQTALRVGGGVKGSGYGRFGGKASIAEFTDLRCVTIEDPGQHYPF
ncbi:hypothetical protein LB524_03610 [Mesorhizobium sp. ESP6-5]|uniref:hypothetical protein n=1 Tax=unclassified Mesorhizobium TaxID=325217 RepID=UPI001CCA83A3|nr:MULTISPECIES: hypothetical protein [unclassified Mesorhizobium]MBZ9722526.1 hypothetical protein [Mesorhizobium sp. CO1-1-11]MBZ9754361.1 hypothetical protein [Mesorhizobium sp. ESP6-5]